MNVYVVLYIFQLLAKQGHLLPKILLLKYSGLYTDFSHFFLCFVQFIYQSILFQMHSCVARLLLPE